jgi:uncharacterized protein with ParB-like and HNH nuclease domain
MKIEADDKEVQDIFSLGYFKIPRFQRPYSWGIDEVESFWDDIISEKSDNYFIGSMVAYQTQKPYFGIVDGQQRLTTITLLLSVIRNGFLKLGEENLAKGVHKYVEKANIDNEDEFILNSETSFPYLQDHIQSYNGFNLDCEAGVEEQKLEKAFDILTKKVSYHIPELDNSEEVQPSLFTNHSSEAINELKALRNKILSLKLVFIQLDNEDDAYLIFETLNARGRDLTTSDLVKNLVLKKLKNKSSTLDQSKEKWNFIVKQFDDIGDSAALDTFLLHYWLAEHEYTTDKKLFAKVKLYIANNEEFAKSLIHDLSAASKYYSSMLLPESGKWNKDEQIIRTHLENLNAFKVKQHSPMTLGLLKAYSEKRLSLKNLIMALYKMEVFHYSFNSITSQRSSGSISTNYSRIAILLSNAKEQSDIQKVLNELNTFYKSKLPDESEFVVKFSELCYLSNKTKHKVAIRYALSKLIPNNGNALPVDYNNLTIEHLIPQAKINDSLSEDLVGRIGNLVLVDKETNSVVLGAKLPDDKLNILNGMGFPLTSNFIDCNIPWTESEIDKRTQKIAKHLYSHLCVSLFA